MRACALLYACGRGCLCPRCVCACMRFSREALLIKQRGDRSAECVFSHAAAPIQQEPLLFSILPPFLLSPLCFLLLLILFSLSFCLICSRNPPLLLSSLTFVPDPHVFFPSAPALQGRLLPSVIVKTRQTLG